MAQEQIDVNKQNYKLALSVFLRTILSAVLSFFVFMSISMIFSGLGTSEIGYQIVEKHEDGSYTIIEEHMYTEEELQQRKNPTATPTSAPNSASTAASSTGQTTASQAEAGEATSGAETTAAATTGTTLPENQVRQAVYSELSAGASAAMDILSMVLMLTLLAAFPYSILWAQGDRDKNSVQFGHMQEDKLRGLKVGALSAIPAAVSYVVLLLSKLGVFLPGYIAAYRFMNVPFLPLINRMVSVSATTPEVSWPVILALLMAVVFVPLVCWAAYALGYKQISITEKLIYVNPNKKKKRRRY